MLLSERIVYFGSLGDGIVIEIRRYRDEDRPVWDAFNRGTKNRLFMFDRGYMDYHRDRFQDHSLMFFREGELVALLPACEREGALFSHAGLTYGGFLTDAGMKQHIMNECFDTLKDYMRAQGFSRLTYKTIPHIYHRQPAEEDRYSLYANNGKLITVDASTYLNLSAPLKMPKGRKAQISRAKREGVTIEILTEQKDYDTFIDLENEVLEARHETHAVHTGAELKLLHDRFPENIHLFAAMKDGKMIAGTVVYEYDTVVHTQYMAANDEARQIGALDLAVATVIEKYRDSKQWMDFGISTEHGRIYLNEGLIAQKEGFGGRTGVYEIWAMDL